MVEVNMDWRGYMLVAIWVEVSPPLTKFHWRVAKERIDLALW